MQTVSGYINRQFAHSWVCCHSHHHAANPTKKSVDPKLTLKLGLRPLWSFFSCRLGTSSVRPGALDSRQNSCFCHWGVWTSSHPAIVLWWWWPKKRLRPSVWLVENPNPDVGWDLRPKLGMYSRGAGCLALIIHFSQACLQHGLSISLLCGSCKQARQFAYLQQHFPLGKILHPLISPVLWFIILELFLLLFIPCIQKSRKLFDCNEHFLCAQYHGKSYFLHFQKLTETMNKGEQQKFHRNNRT